MRVECVIGEGVVDKGGVRFVCGVRLVRVDCDW